MNTDILARLNQTILSRRNAPPQNSYTAQLLKGGPAKILAKYQEEAQELLEAARANDKAAIVHESADLLYHWLVLLVALDVPLSDVLETLHARSGLSGLAEKAARGSKTTT